MLPNNTSVTDKDLYPLGSERFSHLPCVTQLASSRTSLFKGSVRLTLKISSEGSENLPRVQWKVCLLHTRALIESLWGWILTYSGSLDVSVKHKTVSPGQFLFPLGSLRITQLTRWPVASSSARITPLAAGLMWPWHPGRSQQKCWVWGDRVISSPPTRFRRAARWSVSSASSTRLFASFCCLTCFLC